MSRTIDRLVIWKAPECSGLIVYKESPASKRPSIPYGTEGLVCRAGRLELHAERDGDELHLVPFVHDHVKARFDEGAESGEWDVESDANVDAHVGFGLGEEATTVASAFVVVETQPPDQVAHRDGHASAGESDVRDARHRAGVRIVD